MARMLLGWLLGGVFLLAATAPVFAQGTDGTYARVHGVTGVEARLLAGAAGAPAVLTIDADGLVNTGGWSDGQLLVLSYTTPPVDGILEFELIARKPAANAMVTKAFTGIEAHAVLPAPEWISGVRVLASTNEMVVMLVEDAPVEVPQAEPAERPHRR